MGSWFCPPVPLTCLPAGRRSTDGYSRYAPAVLVSSAFSAPLREKIRRTTLPFLGYNTAFPVVHSIKRVMVQWWCNWCNQVVQPYYKRTCNDCAICTINTRFARFLHGRCTHCTLSRLLSDISDAYRTFIGHLRKNISG